MTVRSARPTSGSAPVRPATKGLSPTRTYRQPPRAVLDALTDETDLAAIAASLGAASVPGFCDDEAALLQVDFEPRRDLVRAVSDRIQSGGDPLGEAFCGLRSATERRKVGAVYTPPSIIDGMLSWAETQGAPDRIVDAGAGSGRFLVESGRRFPNARLIAVERDPLAALTARANLAVSGMADRSEVRVENFLESHLGGFVGRTLFIGNPPYVRHHQIPAKWKTWLKAESSVLGVRASALAGLHAYFFLAIAQRGRPGDYGALITSAEWLDVNYGKLVRDLFLHRLGGLGVYVIEPEAEPFPGTATTGAITTFSFGSPPRSARFSRAEGIPAGDDLATGRKVARERLISESRWSDFTRTLPTVPEGFVELGELCRVHRGQVTGANRVWIAGDHSNGLPDEVLFPTVTKARELLDCGPTLTDPWRLRQVIDLPADLSVLDEASRKEVERFLSQAERMGAKGSYVARHRIAWWSVRLREPAPILATYMARRLPAFVLNKARARHLNIAHGLYPREPLAESVLSNLVAWLRGGTSVQGGRVYAGGLTKFEPREMERIRVPKPSSLLGGI